MALLDACDMLPIRIFYQSISQRIGNRGLKSVYTKVKCLNILSAPYANVENGL